MTLSLPEIKLALNSDFTPQQAAKLVQENPSISLTEILQKNSKTMWPYLIYGYQCEYCEPQFVPRVFSPTIYGANQISNSKEVEEASTQPCSPTKFGVAVMYSNAVKSEFKGARKDDPLFKEFFDDLAKGKNKAFVAARLKAATGKDATFLDNPDSPPE